MLTLANGHLQRRGEFGNSQHRSACRRRGERRDACRTLDDRFVVGFRQRRRVSQLG